MVDVGRAEHADSRQLWLTPTDNHGLLGLGLVLVAAAHAGAHAADKLRLSSVAEYRTCIDRHASPEICLGALDVFVKSHPAEALAAG
jgi:hypothetical protein